MVCRKFGLFIQQLLTYFLTYSMNLQNLLSESHSLHFDTLNQIDKKINSYIENASNPINRHKRHDSFNSAVGML